MKISVEQPLSLDRVVPAMTPRIAPQQTPPGEDQPTEYPEPLYCLIGGETKPADDPVDLPLVVLAIECLSQRDCTIP